MELPNWAIMGDRATGYEGPWAYDLTHPDVWGIPDPPEGFIGPISPWDAALLGYIHEADLDVVEDDEHEELREDVGLVAAPEPVAVPVVAAPELAGELVIPGDVAPEEHNINNYDIEDHHIPVVFFFDQLGHAPLQPQINVRPDDPVEAPPPPVEIPNVIAPIVAPLIRYNFHRFYDDTPVGDASMFAVRPMVLYYKDVVRRTWSEWFSTYIVPTALLERISGEYRIPHNDHVSYSAAHMFASNPGRFGRDAAPMRESEIRELGYTWYSTQDVYFNLVTRLIVKRAPERVITDNLAGYLYEDILQIMGGDHIHADPDTVMNTVILIYQSLELQKSRMRHLNIGRISVPMRNF